MRLRSGEGDPRLGGRHTGEMTIGYIVSDPAILGGKPVIRGTRISVEFILELVASGASIADIVQAYPQLQEPAVRAALQYAARFLENEVVVSLSVPS